MTTLTATTHDRVAELFADAQDLPAQAIQRLSVGDVRDAAEKAWCATKRATDARILARSGEEPEITARTTEDLLELPSRAPEAETLVGRYFTHLSYRHGSCFYNGICGPHTERRIPETATYIDAAALAA